MLTTSWISYAQDWNGSGNSYQLHSNNCHLAPLIKKQKFIKSENYKFIKKNHIGFEDTGYILLTKENKNIKYKFSLGTVSTLYITYYFR